MSDASRPSEFLKEQNKDSTSFLNGRPYQHTWFPIGLYHDVFDAFLQGITATGDLSATQYVAVERLLFSSQELYAKQGSRVDIIKPDLDAVLDVHIQKEDIAKCEADGVITVTDGPLHAYCAVLEVKDEIGIGGCDPSIQGAQSYAHYWSQNAVGQGVAVSALEPADL